MAPPQHSAVPTPKNILRGHKSQIHAACFVRGNDRLATGDADGFVILWDLTIMRPQAVWRAHENAILNIRGWGKDRIITHGRDHKLIVWNVGLADEERLSKAPPLEDVSLPRPQPWMLHMLEVNTMNFCPFGACRGSLDPTPGSSDSIQDLQDSAEILIAVPNTLASEAIDIYSLPSQERRYTIRLPHTNGMAMSLALLWHDGVLTLIAAFENGYASVHCRTESDEWTTTYRSQAHDQPVLSLDVHPSQEYFFTSSADSNIAKHPIPTGPPPDLTTERAVVTRAKDEKKPLSSTQLSSDASPSSSSNVSERQAWEHPLKVTNSKHAGQQGLHVRSDGRIFATAGWDSKVRVYSCKTMKELAVLEWHKTGCYAIAFACLDQQQCAERSATGDQDSNPDVESPDADERSVLSPRKSELSVKGKRIQQARGSHWIAAGAKDGRVSLWDVY